MPSTNDLSPNAFPIQLPIGFEKDINGIVDLVKMKSYTYKEHKDKGFVEGEVPADMLEKAKEYRLETDRKSCRIR
jgi:elongation factor G